MEQNLKSIETKGASSRHCSTLPAEATSQCNQCENVAKNMLYIEKLLEVNFAEHKECKVCQALLTYLQHVNRCIEKQFSGIKESLEEADTIEMTSGDAVAKQRKIKKTVSIKAVSSETVTAKAVSTTAMSTTAVSAQALSAQALSAKALSSKALSSKALSSKALSSKALSSKAVSAKGAGKAKTQQTGMKKPMMAAKTTKLGAKNVETTSTNNVKPQIMRQVAGKSDLKKVLSEIVHPKNKPIVKTYIPRKPIVQINTKPSQITKKSPRKTQASKPTASTSSTGSSSGAEYKSQHKKPPMRGEFSGRKVTFEKHRKSHFGAKKSSTTSTSDSTSSSALSSFPARSENATSTASAAKQKVSSSTDTTITTDTNTNYTSDTTATKLKKSFKPKTKESPVKIRNRLLAGAGATGIFTRKSLQAATKKTAQDLKIKAKNAKLLTAPQNSANASDESSGSSDTSMSGATSDSSQTIELATKTNTVKPKVATQAGKSLACKRDSAKAYVTTLKLGHKTKALAKHTEAAPAIPAAAKKSGDSTKCKLNSDANKLIQSRQQKAKADASAAKQKVCFSMLKQVPISEKQRPTAAKIARADTLKIAVKNVRGQSNTAKNAPEIQNGTAIITEASMKKVESSPCLLSKANAKKIPLKIKRPQGQEKRNELKNWQR